jgi:uncharacterized membrane protein
MHYGWRAPALRLTALSALVVSAALTADRLHPGRGFCPLAEACNAARNSALGTIHGVPTSTIGMLAFGALFFLTLLPVEWGRRLLRPAGILAALAGAGLFIYQATVLHSFCPLCLVADAAGLFAGMITITWPKPPIRRSGKRLPGEPIENRLRWTAVACIAMALPFVVPREVNPGWVEIQEIASVDLDGPDTAPTSLPAPKPPVAEAPKPPPATPPPPQPAASWKPPAPTALPWIEPGGAGSLPASASPRPEPPTATPSPRLEPAPLPPAPPPPAPPAPPAPPPAPKADATVIEYLNAFCPHCRATHARFDRATARSGLVVRFRRVYTWTSTEPPLWARVCVAARGQGLEERVFAEMLHAANDSPGEIWEAARRAGADLDAIRVSMEAPETHEKLTRHRQAVASARLQGLPTLDIGRRRLMGEQSEAEIRDALDAARALTRGS